MSRLLFLLLLVGCAPLTEDQRFERDYSYALEIESYNERMAACHAAGGIWVTQFHQRKYYKPSAHDLRMAGCQ